MADISENYIKQIELVQKNESTGNNESTFINIGSPHLKRIKCSDLKNLKDNGKLEEGTWYRITDYGSGGETPDFYGHAFDILVLAVSNNKLSEECRATHHVKNNTPDPYFGEGINAWKIWYSVNDDKYGKIYRMIDEYGNDCPYDFKNVKVNGGYTFSIEEGKDASLSSSCINNIILSDNNITLKGEMEIKNNIIGRECSNILLTNSNNVTILDNCSDIKCETCKKFYEVKIGTNCNNLIFLDEGDDISFKHIYVDADTKNVIIKSTGLKVVHDIYIHHSVSGETIVYDKDVNCIQHYEKNQNGVICNWHV